MHRSSSPEADADARAPTECFEAYESLQSLIRHFPQRREITETHDRSTHDFCEKTDVPLLSWGNSENAYQR
jgi:hypothetical protein